MLTRSTSRAQLFWAKTLTAAGFAVLVLVVLAASTIVVERAHRRAPAADRALRPDHPRRPRRCGWSPRAGRRMLPPMLGFTCLAILLSVWSRNPAVGIAAPVVIGMVMQLVGALGGVEAIRPFLLTTPFESWHGLLADPRFTGPLDRGPGHQRRLVRRSASARPSSCSADATSPEAEPMRRTILIVLAALVAVLALGCRRRRHQRRQQHRHPAPPRAVPAHDVRQPLRPAGPLCWAAPASPRRRCTPRPCATRPAPRTPTSAPAATGSA